VVVTDIRCPPWVTRRYAYDSLPYSHSVLYIGWVLEGTETMSEQKWGEAYPRCNGLASMTPYDGVL
jgi:hypothetical protein